MIYKIEIIESALKTLRKLPKIDANKIANKITALAQNPRPNGVQKLAGDENGYRIRSGDYRILYEIHDKILVILVVKIGHRREVYRDM